METDRAIGMLQGELKGIQETQKHHDVRFDRIEGKLDTLLADKWKRNGAVLVVSVIVSFMASLIIEIARAGR